ncbi:MAG: hypothetical protein PVF96_08045 [Candidatus Bathyarchaeota archaeon]
MKQRETAENKRNMHETSETDEIATSTLTKNPLKSLHVCGIVVLFTLFLHCVINVKNIYKSNFYMH